MGRTQMPERPLSFALVAAQKEGGFSVRPNPSLNTRPSTAERLAREALTVYAAPRGQGARPLRAR